MKVDKLDIEPRVIWFRRKKALLSCSRCKPHRNENRTTKKKKHGTRPPRSKNRPKGE